MKKPTPPARYRAKRAHAKAPEPRDESSQIAPGRGNKPETGFEAATAEVRQHTAKQLLAASGELVRPTPLGGVFDVTAYLYEIKYDGYRLRAVKAGDEVMLVTRGGHDWTARFSPLAAAVSRLPPREAVLDGEVCVVDDAGRPSFQALQEWLAGERPAASGAAALSYVLFDLTWLDGRDLRDRPLEERRALLEALLRGTSAPLSFSRASEAASRAELEAITGAVRRAGLEGLVAKRRGSRYLPGQSGVWRKLKFSRRQDCAIVGWVPMTGAPKVLGALILAVVEAGELRFAGKVGTGLDDVTRERLRARLDTESVATPAVPVPKTVVPGARWVRPTLVCEVEFVEWSRDGSLRTPVWIRLREDKTPDECTLDEVVDTPEVSPPERSSPATAPLPLADPDVPLSNPTKILFPRDGITKRDIRAYYLAVAPVLLPHLASRPVTLQRWPDGIDDEEWYQHNAPYPLPPFVHTLAFEQKKKRVIVDNVETLAWLVNLAALTLHVWSSRVPTLDQPDYTVLDLDPGDGEWADLIRVAHAIRTILDSLSLPSVVKTSGKRGLHVFVPLAPGQTHEAAIAFAERVAEAVAKVMPDVATTERSIARRKGRLYVDATINGQGKSVVAPYAIRALDGAPVSTPVAWSEVTTALDPRAFTIRTVAERVAARGDLFALALRGRGRV